MDSPWSSVPRLIHLAETYRAAGNTVAALAALRDALVEAPDDPELLVIYGRTLIDARELDAAEQAVLAAQALDPEDPEGHLVMAIIHMARGAFGLAQTECDQSLIYDPDQADVHFIRGTVLEAYHQTEEAEAAFMEALKLVPSSAVVSVALAQIMLDRGDRASADALLGEVDEEGQSHPDYVLMMGQFALNELRFDEAQDRAIWALQYEPDNMEAIALLANVKFARSRFTGLPFRLALWWDRMPAWLRITLGIAGALGFAFCATRWQSGGKDGVTLAILLGLLAVAAFAVSRSYILDWLVQRGLRNVRLKDF